MCLVDSDFDTEDEEFGDDIEEVIAKPSMDYNESVAIDDFSSDEVAQVEALPSFMPPRRAKLIGSDSAKLLRSAREFRDKKRKALAQSILD